MQAKLEPAELAYLLHILDAQKVVGVNNAQLFPAEPSTRDRLLKLGFSRLQENGWFVATDGKINADSRLLLLVAAMVNPDYVFTVTYFPGNNLRQTITYYVAAEVVVEQFGLENGDCLLNQLPAVTALAERLAQLFSLEKNAARVSLSFDLTGFETALTQAKTGDSVALRQALEANPVSSARVAELVDMIGGFQPAGKIEGAAIAGDRLIAWRELAFLRDRQGRLWLTRKNEVNNRLELASATEHQFGEFFRQLLDGLTLARHELTVAKPNS